MSRITIFSKKIIIEAGYNFLIKNGMKDMSFRALAKSSHFSTQPIYTAFGSIKHLHDTIMTYALYQFDIQLYKYNPTNSLDLDLEIFLLKYLFNNHGILKLMLSEKEYSAKFYDKFSTLIKKQTNISDNLADKAVIKHLSNLLGLAQVINLKSLSFEQAQALLIATYKKD